MAAESAYTPVWKSDDGNRIIFMGKADICESSGYAYARQMQAYPAFRQFGLAMDGVAKLSVNEDGTYAVPHVDVKFGPWSGHCIGGPIFDEAASLADETKN